MNNLLGVVFTAPAGKNLPYGRASIASGAIHRPQFRGPAPPPAPSSTQAPYHLPRRERQGAFIPLCLLSKRNPLRWTFVWLGRKFERSTKSVNKTVTDCLCLCGLGKEIVQVEGLDKVLSELKAQGRNLNQLTTLANMGKVTILRGDALADKYEAICGQLCHLLREVN